MWRGGETAETPHRGGGKQEAEADGWAHTRKTMDGGGDCTVPYCTTYDRVNQRKN
jgi:hypothetical protein